MRASKKRSRKSEVGSLKSKGGKEDIHISGAEGLYDEEKITAAAVSYIKRALGHSRGRPDSIVLTVEEVKQKPLRISSLSVRTAEAVSVSDAEKTIFSLLEELGISQRAIRNALSLVRTAPGMRGAAFLRSQSGKKAGPDTKRGVRVSRLGITAPAKRLLRRRLSAHSINTDTVLEALVLASKVASCREIIAELCISDDPDYTTGYVASRDIGYVRVPSIKTGKSLSGGRVFFIGEKTDPSEVAEYLERRPVLIETISQCHGISPADEIIRYHHS